MLISINLNSSVYFDVNVETKCIKTANFTYMYFYKRILLSTIQKHEMITFLNKEAL